MPIVLALVCLLLLNAYAALLIVLRARVYRVPLYRPMLVNVGLSFVPVVGVMAGTVVMLLLVPTFGGLASRAGWLGFLCLWLYLIVVAAVWLLFFPNSIYLITELNFSHRRADDPVPLWYDIVQTLALTLSGIFNAVGSLALAQTAVVAIVDPSASRSSGPPAASWTFAGIVLVLGAVGVYLGRYLRVNSWDVRHPRALFAKLGAHLRQPGKALEAAAFTLSHAVLVGIVYVPIYALFYHALLP